MINEREIKAAKKQGWIMRYDTGMWKRWSGPWPSIERARDVIDKYITPIRPDEMLVVVGTQVMENPWGENSGNWSFQPDYSQLPI